MKKLWPKQTLLTVLFTIVLVSLCAPALAQQEVDPDHFDQPAATKPAVKAAVQSATKQVRGKTNAANRGAKAKSSKRMA